MIAEKRVVKESMALVIPILKYLEQKSSNGSSGCETFFSIAMKEAIRTAAARIRAEAVIGDKFISVV